MYMKFAKRMELKCYHHIKKEEKEGRKEGGS
jgi:hypothetical protein